MASTKTSPTILHMRDFVEHVGPDPTRPGKSLAMQLQSPLNIPFQLDAQSIDVQGQEIPTLIRFFCETAHLPLYEPEVFVYAWGSFLTTTTEDGLQIILNANAVSRYVILMLPCHI
jgi:hypothetical protein